MTERPILMSGPMVRACYREIDPKTQTRRVVKPQPDYPDRCVKVRRESDGWYFIVDQPEGFYLGNGPYRCPYGKPGDLLWVREAWKVQPTPGCSLGDAMMARKLSVFYRADSGRRDFTGGTADGPGLHVDFVAFDYDPAKYGIWRPSIHMPKWAARLWLRITDVRVERLQDISDRDCEAEGIQPSKGGPVHDWRESENGWHRDFRILWDSINVKRGYGWDTNPYVWVVSFEKASAPGDGD